RVPGRTRMVTFASPPRPPAPPPAPPAPPEAPNTSNVAEVIPAGTVHVALPTALNVSVRCVGVLVTVAVGVLVAVAVVGGLLVAANPVGVTVGPVCPKF